ncbi:MAG: dienelactone hydrolase family protein [Microthrixaceae bacterium]
MKIWAGPITGAIRLGVLAVVVALAGVACTPVQPATGPSPDDAPRSAEPAYAGAGPYDVGVRTVELSDRSMEVWYPVDRGDIDGHARDSYRIRSFVSGAFEQLIDPSVDPVYETNAVRDAPVASSGHFPLVLFAHGFASFRLQSSELTTHLASWGFVVISPDFLDRGLKAVLGEPPAVSRSDQQVTEEAINAMRSIAADPASGFHGTLDAWKVYPVGHSAGGGTAVSLLSRPDVPSAVALASGFMVSSLTQGTFTPAFDKPIMWVGGRDDHIDPIDDVRLAFSRSAGERKLVEITSGHLNGFTDICEIGDGGIAALARATQLPIPDFLLQLGDDGCPTPPNLASPQVWPTLNHFVTAELRYRSGLDSQPVGLGSGVTAAFPGTLVDYRHTP